MSYWGRRNANQAQPQQPQQDPEQIQQLFHQMMAQRQRAQNMFLAQVTRGANNPRMPNMDPGTYRGMVRSGILEPGPPDNKVDSFSEAYDPDVRTGGDAEPWG